MEQVKNLVFRNVTLTNRDKIKRIVFHWSSGTYIPSIKDRFIYHFMVDNRGDYHPGFALMGDITRHTCRFNEGSVAICLCGMKDATRDPLNIGNFPINITQLKSACRLGGVIAHYADIEVNNKNVLCHSEILKEYGIHQRGVHDIDFLPWSLHSPPEMVHHLIRKKVEFYRSRVVLSDG